MAQPALKKETPPVHTPGRGRIYELITDTIGDTPIVRLDRIAKEHNIRANLGQTRILQSDCERQGPYRRRHDRRDGSVRKDHPGQDDLVEPTSGNTEIALAFVAAARGYKLILVMPETMSIERRKMLALLGATIELTPGPGGMKAAIAKAHEIIASTPNAVCRSNSKIPPTRKSIAAQQRRKSGTTRKAKST